MTECIIMATTKGEDDNHHHAYGNHPTTKHQQHKNNNHTDHSSNNTLPLTTTLEEKKIESPQDDKMTAWTMPTSSNNNCDDEDHKRNDNNANHHHLHHHHHHVTFPQEKPPSSTTTTTTPTTSSSTSDCIVHRVHLASTASQEDDWVTEKSLTASAADRLGKKHRNAHHSQQQQTWSSHHPNNNTRQSSQSACTTTCTTTTTTEEHFSTSDQIGFYGAYAKVRQTLDYSYHVHYRKERQWLHDAIIEDNLLKHQQAQDASQAQAQQSQPQDANRSDSSTTSSSTMSDYHQGTPVLLPRNPCLIFMVGVHGAAKHSTVRQLLDQQRLRLLSLVCVDTDDLRRYLPEYATYRQSCPSSVDQRTRKEAGYISECLTMAALQAGRNVIYYGSLKDVRWYCDKFIPTLKQQFPCGRLKTALIHVTSDVDAAFGRAQQRARATGRILDEAEFRTELQETIPKACQQLRPVVDYYAELRNNNRNGNHQSSGGGGRCGGGGPELPRNMPDNNNNNNNNTGGGDDLELLTDDGDWTEFTKAFDQRGSILSLSRPNSNHRKQNNNNINNQEHPLQRPLLQRMPPTPVVHTHHRRVSSIRRISACATSEENHLADDMEFYGAFAAFRASLDYTFHKNYTFERQHFQDAIIREFLFSGPTANTNSTNTTTETNTTNTRPWAVFTGTYTSSRVTSNTFLFPIVSNHAISHYTDWNL